MKADTDAVKGSYLLKWRSLLGTTSNDNSVAYSWNLIVVFLSYAMAPQGQGYGYTPSQPDTASYGGYGQAPPTSFMTPAPVSQSQTANVMTPMPPSGFQPGPNAGMPHAASASAPAPAPAPVEKPPIPAEHKVLQDTFEALRTKCLAAANHPVSLIFYYFNVHVWTLWIIFTLY